MNARATLAPPSEIHVQGAILDLLRVAYPEVLVASFPNGGYRMDPRAVAKLKRQGLRPGMPDLALYWHNGHAMVEVKTPTGRVSPEQRDVHDRLRLLGHRVVIWRSVEDAQADLEAWRVRGRVAA